MSRSPRLITKKDVSQYKIVLVAVQNCTEEVQNEIGKGRIDLSLRQTSG